MNAQQLKAELAQYYGSETAYRHALNAKFNYTEGMKALFTHAGGGAYWLSDILATEPDIARGVKENDFCVGVVESSGSTATITVCVDYKDDAEPGQRAIQVLWSRHIDVTDFPEGTWKFYLAYPTIGSSSVLFAMLPREY